MHEVSELYKSIKGRIPVKKIKVLLYYDFLVLCCLSKKCRAVIRKGFNFCCSYLNTKMLQCTHSKEDCFLDAGL